MTSIAFLIRFLCRLEVTAEQFITIFLRVYCDNLNIQLKKIKHELFRWLSEMKNKLLMIVPLIFILRPS